MALYEVALRELIGKSVVCEKIFLVFDVENTLAFLVLVQEVTGTCCIETLGEFIKNA